MEKRIKEKIVGQEGAVTTVAAAIRRKGKALLQPTPGFLFKRFAAIEDGGVAAELIIYPAPPELKTGSLSGLNLLPKKIGFFTNLKMAFRERASVINMISQLLDPP